MTDPTMLDRIVDLVARGADVNFVFIDYCDAPSRHRYTTNQCRCRGCTKAHTDWTKRYRARLKRNP